MKNITLALDEETLAAGRAYAERRYRSSFPAEGIPIAYMHETPSQ